MNKKEKKTEDAMRIFEALSGVDEELLIRCEEDTGAVTSVKKVRPIWYYGKVVAACFCFVVCGAVLLNMGALLFRDHMSATDMASNTGNGMNSGAEAGNAAVTMEDSVVEESAKQEAAMEECVEDALEGGVAEESFMENSIENTVEQSEATDWTEAVKEVAVAEGAANNTSEKANSNVEGEYRDNNKIEDLQGKQTTDSLQGCVVDYREDISLKVAQETEYLGKYVPDTLPKGYLLESAKRTCNQITGEVLALSLCWTKGMDYIRLDITKINRADYDSTVFDYPVFAAADFHLDTVKECMKVVEDSGDTATPRGNFGVLYEDDILVKFNGRGDAESIYEIFD